MDCFFCMWCRAVQPRNYLLFACHTFNVTAQLNQLRRAIEYKLQNVPNAAEELQAIGTKVASAMAVLAGLVLTSGRMQKVFSSKAMPEFVQKICSHPAGPFTIFFWAPTSKWLLSGNNLVDLNKPTEKISLAQQTALTTTGVIWARYSMVINPINYNLMIVNLALGISSGYHLSRKLKAEYFNK